MATATQRSRLRNDVGAPDDETVITNAAIDDYFVRATEDYPSGSAAVLFASAKIYALRQMKAKAHKFFDYDQNDSSVKKSQVFKNIDSLLKDAKAELADALDADAGSAVKISRTRRKPTRIVEYPDG